MLKKLHLDGLAVIFGIITIMLFLSPVTSHAQLEDNNTDVENVSQKISQMASQISDSTGMNQDVIEQNLKQSVVQIAGKSSGQELDTSAGQSSAGNESMKLKSETQSETNFTSDNNESQNTVKLDLNKLALDYSLVVSLIHKAMGEGSMENIQISATTISQSTGVDKVLIEQTLKKIAIMLLETNVNVQEEITGITNEIANDPDGPLCKAIAYYSLVDSTGENEESSNRLITETNNGRSLSQSIILVSLEKALSVEESQDCKCEEIDSGKSSSTGDDAGRMDNALSSTTTTTTTATSSSAGSDNSASSSNESNTDLELERMIQLSKENIKSLQEYANSFLSDEMTESADSKSEESAKVTQKLSQSGNQISSSDKSSQSLVQDATQATK